MSAVKIIFKRSSILGKRPTGTNLEPGELGLNTNSSDPGLFFEVNDGSVVKAGPTAYLPEAPTSVPSLGELWVDRDTKSLSIGTEKNTWQKVAAPFLGGTGGFTVFVAPEYPNATDSLANDGQTVPFLTVNRAVIEVTKQIIIEENNNISTGNNRYQIVLAPGRHCVVNGPGQPTSSFSVDYASLNTSVTQVQLQQFNPVQGGLILPRGVSIIGLDLKKCEVRPTYVPKYTHPAFPKNYVQQAGGPVYENETLSSIFSWSGNTYQSQFSAFDKVDERSVISVIPDTESGNAIFKSDRPHGLSYNDFVQVNYSNSADQSGTAFKAGVYYAYPLNPFQFLLSIESWSNNSLTPVAASSLPSAFLNSTSGSPKLRVENVYPYYIPLDGLSYELSNYSHHRLSLNKNVALTDLNDFYKKVQLAFPVVFGGAVNQNVVDPSEVVIVAPTDPAYPNNTISNSTNNSSPYQNMVNLRSNYGLANGDYDGSVVSGFRSVIVNSSTAVSLQSDPAAYELYATSSQQWQNLCEFSLQQLPNKTPITSVPTSLQLQDLNEAAIPNIRYYYKFLTVSTGESIGVADPDNDFRHFGFRMSGSNSFMQAQSVYTIGPAIGVWATNGAYISQTGATSNFGSVAFQAEGFAGIGTLGGANDVNKGFLQAGIMRPLQLTEGQVSSDSQKRILPLGSRIVHIGVDPSDPSVQLVYLQREFNPASILPYSLKPGSAFFTTDGLCEFRGFFVTNGTPTCIRSESDTATNPYSPGGAILRLRVSDSSIPNGDATGLDVPYIRRFTDPRTADERAYGFYVQSTNPTSQAPQLGSVLRLNQTGQSLSNTIKRNYQFDPGQNGGISQVFTVDFVDTVECSTSANFNYKISDSSQSTNYVVYASLSDASTPWTQSVSVDNGSLTPINTPQGTYTTYYNRNYYAAENNIWSSLYYASNFTVTNGPTKVSPDKLDSPFVTTSVLERQESIRSSWQGYVPDPFYDYYITKVPASVNANFTYMRGAVVPYTEFAAQYPYDNDDGSIDLGLLFKKVPVPAGSSITVAGSKIIQTQELMTTPFVASPTFGRPAVIQLEVLSVQGILNPRQGTSVVQLSNPSVGAVEYVQVISLNSNLVQGIRNYYPAYSQGTIPSVWPAGTVISPCVTSGFAEPSIYDPAWSVTKATMYRYFQLMGYTSAQMESFLVPKYFGERLLLNTDLPYSPVEGYANITASWPIEFNNPSTVNASGHSWQSAGYFDYSRGLPKYQVNEISKKLQYDYYSTTAWGGRLTILGSDELGNQIFFGPVKEALTGQYYVSESPVTVHDDRQRYLTPDPVQHPSPILVFSTDDISGSFDNVQKSFSLTRGGYLLPSTQLSTYGVFVFLGGVSQLPGVSYSIEQSAAGEFIPSILFSEAPPKGASCDIRIVTSDDEAQTISVVSFSLLSPFNGITSSFDLSPDLSALSDENSFVFLGGVEQNPFGSAQTSASYTISPPGSTTSSLNFIGGAPLDGATIDVRGILSGERYRNAGISAVFITSVDDIAPLFNNTATTFPLAIGTDSLDPTRVNAQNMFVSLGGVMQIPVASAGNPLSGNAYTVQTNSVTNALEITFATPPAVGATCNIRVVTSDQFITCPLTDAFLSNALQDGPGVIVDEFNRIVSIDPGLINP